MITTPLMAPPPRLSYLRQKYIPFIEGKTQLSGNFGFEPTFMPDCAFGFQQHLASWAIRKGKAAILASCGLGKTVMELIWAQNVVEHTNKPVLILTPLAVGGQTAREGEKFGIECKQSRDGGIHSKITITNYHQLHRFNWQDFSGVVCDESGILKNFDGKFKAEITEFMRKLPFRLLCTATPAPNDFIELGTHSEALGELGYIDMLKMFFKANDNTYAQGGGRGGRWSKDPFAGKFRFRGHAERDFWRWVCSWARAVRKPSDIGFEDIGFDLPPLVTEEHIVKATTARTDMLIDLPATNLHEQRAERRRTLRERCEKAAQLIIENPEQSIAWVNLNDEGKQLASMLPGCEEISGEDWDEKREEILSAFIRGEVRNLVSKSSIFGFGLNLQNCRHQTYFVDHSYERWHQAVRRSWRFGQTKPVHVDVIACEGERGVLANLNRKSEQAEQMFSQLVELMNSELRVDHSNRLTNPEEIPSWL